MSVDTAKLKELAENYLRLIDSEDHDTWAEASDAYDDASDADTVLALIAENEANRHECEVVCANYDQLKTENAQLKKQEIELKAECEGLRVALVECSDSLRGEMLQKFGGQLPDDMHPITRREYDRDMAEVAGYRAAVGGIEPTLDTPDDSCKWTAEDEASSRAVYEQWANICGYVPWIEGGNSLKQEEARRMHCAIEGKAYSYGR